MKLEVLLFTWDYLDSNMYVLKNGKHLLMVDPIDNEEALNHCKYAETITILLTHEHVDHICGLNALRSLAPYKVKVIASSECSKRICSPKLNMSAYANVLMELAEKPVNMVLPPFSCAKADIVFDERYTFNWFEVNVEMISTPGHSPGSVCIVIGNMLFSGDTLLENRFMTRFPGGNTKLFRKKTVPILENLLNCVDFVYPGHGTMMTREMALRMLQNEF